MIEGRPDWVVSRQRAWGVPITVFRHKETGEVIPSPKFAKSKELIARIAEAFAEKGADVWFADGRQGALPLDGLVDDPSEWEQVRDILDVWFEFRLARTPSRSRTRSTSPASPASSACATAATTASCTSKAPTSTAAGSSPRCSRSCGTRGRAPYDIVLTHGFILDEKGEEKMSKSKGNTLSPQDVMKTSGADILRLWVASADYRNDIRFGPAIVQASVEAYRKLRNTLRWMLGALAHFEPGRVKFKDMHDLELERLMLHRLAELDARGARGLRGLRLPQGRRACSRSS